MTQKPLPVVIIADPGKDLDVKKLPCGSKADGVTIVSNSKKQEWKDEFHV